MNSVASNAFLRDAASRAADLRLRAVVARATTTYHASVARGKERFQDWEEARRQAAAVKWEAIQHLDTYLEQFESNLRRRGGRVFWAESADDCCQYLLDLCRRNNVRKVAKAKSMATEEIHLNDRLLAHGIEVVETDLGEFIVQLRGEPPYHIVTPAMHLRREDIAALFAEKLGARPDSSAEELTAVARRELRQQFCTADMGITGGNFLIAETGSVVTCTNEGNGRLAAGLPRIHVAIVGIEKILPRLEHLALFLPLLATSGTGQPMTVYNTLWNGPRQPGEPDGPDEFHVILLDNGRTALLADAEQREALHCIRCGACLNACPIFRTIGGHAYHTTYQGPIGAVITPHLRGLADFHHLSYASSLCGNCTDVCPVHIELHHHLLHNRRNAARAGMGGPLERWAFQFWAWLMTDARRYRWAVRLGRLGQCLVSGPSFSGSPLDPLQRWTRSRELPTVAEQTFKDWWAQRRGPPRQEKTR